MGDCIVNCQVCKHPVVSVGVREIRMRVDGRATLFQRKSVWACPECLRKNRGKFKIVKHRWEK